VDYKRCAPTSYATGTPATFRITFIVKVSNKGNKGNKGSYLPASIMSGPNEREFD
jgi:hypothetical protein